MISTERRDIMGSYEVFASVYDLFMDNVPYDTWSEYLIRLLKKYKVGDGLVLDLGCGTGNITERLAKQGYEMIGIDNSEEMLSLAIEKQDKSSGILYLNQDMREFELYGTVAAIVSICDSMNYILEEEELLEVFRLANNYLDPGGIFIFDLNTIYKYKNVLGDTTIAENRKDSSFIWENFYYEDERINEYDLTIFVKEDDDNSEADGGLYRCHKELHQQKAYTIDTVKNLLEQAGMEFITAYDAFTEEAPSDTSERIYIVAKEGHQSGKTYIKE